MVGIEHQDVQTIEAERQRVEEEAKAAVEDVIEDAVEEEVAEKLEERGVS